MSIRNLVDDLESTLGLDQDDEDDFLAQMSLEFNKLCDSEKTLSQLPTLESELEKQKTLLAKANETVESVLLEKNKLSTILIDYQTKTAQLQQQQSEQELKIKKLEEESKLAREQLEAEKRVMAEALKQKEQQQRTATKTIASFSKKQVIYLQTLATESLEKCQSLQKVLGRHATVYGKENVQFKKLSLMYKKEKDLLAERVAKVKQATDSLQTTFSIAPRYKIENVF